MAPSDVDALIEEFAPVAAALELERGALVERIVTAVREEIPSYRALPHAALYEAVALEVQRGLQATRGDARPSGADLEEAALVGREAARFDVPIEDLLGSLRTGVRIFWTECVARATERGLDPRTLVAAAELIWGWADAVGAAMVRGHREVSVQEALHRERQRSSFLLGVLEGSIAGSELLTGAQANGVELEREYLPVRARAFDQALPSAYCEREIRRALGPAAAGAIVLAGFEDDLAGIVPERPLIDDRHLLVGVGPPASLERLAPSYREAVQALEVATRFRLRGTVDLAELSLRTAVANHMALGGRVVSRVLGPLRDGSHLGAEIEQTVRAHLEAGLRIEPAAERLGVHTNTVRNRLRRFEQLTNSNLRDPAHIAELWWALQYDQIAEPTSPEPRERVRRTLRHAAVGDS